MSTAFSYAQAARGQTSAQPPAPQSVASQAASTTSSQSRDAATTSTTSASASAASAAPSTTSNDVDANDITPKPSSQPESLSKGEAETDAHQSKEEESSQKVRLSATASPITVQDSKKQTLENPAQGTERRLKGLTSSTRASDVSDNKKSRKGKKAKGVEKDSEQDQADKEKEVEVPKAQLSEAPIPAVNIWQLRAKEAQQKVTPSAALRPAANSSNSLSPTTPDPKPKSSNSGIENSTTQNRPTPNGLKNQKKGNEFTRENNEHAPRRTAVRGNRTGEKADKVEKAVYESLPSVADVSSWPTPVSAATEVKAPEKVEKQDEKEEPKEEPKQDSSHKGKTNWVQLPYVPSPSFQTQFQTRSGRGGRAGGQRGGRENGTRGGHAGASNSVDKSQGTTFAKASSGTQERANENTASGKAAPLPHAAKRGSVDNSTLKDTRKASTGTNAEAAKYAAKSPAINGTAESFKHTQGESSFTTSNPQQAVSGSSVSTEKPTSSSSRAPDTPRDSTAQSGKEPNSHAGSRAEGNSRDRPRGGGQRGKGSFTGANGMSHFYTNPNDQQPYPLPGNLPPRQNSYPMNMPQLPYGNQFPGSIPASGHRATNSRNASTTAPYYGRQSNGRNSRGPPLQTPPQNFGFEPSMHPASAFPGQAPYYPEQNMMALVTRQLEYYFSIENLLKDEWLRGHMDSQGFVLFDVIADFKRMKAMTQDKNLILAACEGSAEIELVVGNDDGRERIRRRHGWEKWVYPLGSRHAGANYDQGPSGYHVRSFYPYQPPMMPPYAMESPGVFSPTPFDAHFGPYMNVGMYGYGNGMSNGVNGHGAAPRESSLSAAVPEFSPAAGPSGSDLERGSLVEGSKDAAISGEGQGHDAGNAVTLNGDAPTTNGSHEDPNATEIVQPYTNGFGGGHEAEGH